MFLDSFKSVGLAIFQVFFLGAMGYFLVKRSALSESGLDTLSRLVVKITLPSLIFCQLLKDFSFAHYNRWWVFPLLSVVITLAGFIAGSFAAFTIKDRQRRTQFFCLNAFQNSGYIPLVLIVELFSGKMQDTMFVYLFLFLLGFNTVIWSVGPYFLARSRTRDFKLGEFFTPPVIATLVSLLAVFFGLQRLVPQVVLKPLHMIGECTVPLAMFVVGGSLALIKLRHFDLKSMALLVLTKMILLPAAGLGFLLWLRLPELVGYFIMIELAAPPATTLTLITRHYKNDDILISQGVFVGHLVSLITLPLFLSLYFMLGVVQ